MLVLNLLSDLIDRPELLGGAEKPAGLGRTCMLGYLAGTVGIFAFMRIFSALPPGLLSFAALLLLILALNFFMAGVIHLFMDLTGARGSAGRLFLAFGLSDYLLVALLPLAFLAKAAGLGGFLWYSLCVLLLIYARVRLVRLVYPVSANKALLGVMLPYAGLFTVTFLGSMYLLVWLVWLML